MLEIVRTAGCEVVDNSHLPAAFEKPVDQVAADETGAASYNIESICWIDDAHKVSTV